MIDNGDSFGAEKKKAEHTMLHRFFSISISSMLQHKGVRSGRIVGSAVHR